MSADTKIEWTDRTWNPVRGCSVISPGCVNCYAMKQAHRFSGEGMGFEGLTKQTKAGPQWTGVVREHASALDQPLGWKKPQRIFVNSMSDLFHEGVSDAFIDQIFAVMALAPQHTFQILTKRPQMMLAYMRAIGRRSQVSWAMGKIMKGWPRDYDARAALESDTGWPLQNVHLGVSAENQEMLDYRLPLLMQTPAAVRFLSCEPLLSGLDIAKHRPGASRLWVIVGGESGPGARPCDVAWVRSIVRQCQQSDTPVFVKQLGRHPFDSGVSSAGLDYSRYAVQMATGRVVPRSITDSKGGDPAEWPEDLRVREFPHGDTEQVVGDAVSEARPEEHR